MASSWLRSAQGEGAAAASDNGADAVTPEAEAQVTAAGAKGSAEQRPPSLGPEPPQHRAKCKPDGTKASKKQDARVEGAAGCGGGGGAQKQAQHPGSGGAAKGSQVVQVTTPVQILTIGLTIGLIRDSGGCR